MNAVLDDHTRAHVRAVVGGEFSLDPRLIFLDLMHLASTPRRVRAAIARHQAAIDLNPSGHLKEVDRETGMTTAALQAERVAAAAARYLGLPVDSQRPGTTYIAQTHNTTTGLALVANGVGIGPRQEVVTSEHDFSGHRETWRLRCEQDGRPEALRVIQLFKDPSASGLDEEILASVERELRPNTRILALTWVHSNTGVKLPAARIGEIVARHNEGRAPENRILFSLDAVHGFGIEDADFEDLRCDFFVAGCHKWLLGPRGTGIICALPEAWAHLTPTIPTSNPAPTGGALNSPGGAQASEYAWAVAEAFELHAELGRRAVARYTHALAGHLKRGLAEMRHVHLVTPMDEALSAGVVCCDVDDVTPDAAVAALRRSGIVAMTSSSDVGGKRHLRFSPSVLNDERDIARALDAVAMLRVANKV